MCAGLLLLLRGDRRPAARGQPAGADASPDGGVPPARGVAAGPAEAESTNDPGEPKSSGEAPDPSLDGAGLAIGIEGTVTDASGNGLAAARVAALRRSALNDAIVKDAKLLERDPLEALRTFQRSLGDVAKRLPSCLTGDDGTYALRGLPDGDYRVVVTHPEFLTHESDDWILVQAGRRARYGGTSSPPTPYRLGFLRAS